MNTDTPSIADALPSFLRTPEPYPDESPMGYVLRVAEHNCYESPNWILRLAGLDPPAFEKRCRGLGALSVDAGLERFMGLFAHQLCVLVETLVVKDAGGGESRIPRSTIPAVALRPRYRKVCPECLRERSYCRSSWDLVCVTACPTHRAVLLDACPACQRRVGWNRPGVSVCRCRYDWRDHPTVPIEDAQMLATTLLMRAVDGIGTGAGDAQQRCDPAGGLPLGDRCRVLLALAPLAVVAGQSGHLARGVSNTERHEAMEFAARVLTPWPSNFHRFCEQIVSKGSRFALANRLDRLATRDSLAFLRIEFDRHIDTRRLIPADVARLELDRNAPGSALPKSAGPVRILRVEPDTSAEWGDRERRKEVRATGARLPPKAQVARTLGIRDEQLDEAIAAECLTVASGPDIDGFSEGRLDTGAVSDLFDRFDHLAEPPPGRYLAPYFAHEYLRLDQVAARLHEEHVEFGAWLCAVLDGRITPYRCLPRARGRSTPLLSKFAFFRGALADYIKRRQSKRKAGVPRPRHSSDE